jgi:hypothetical protein
LDVEKFGQHQKAVVWFVWFIWFIWLVVSTKKPDSQICHRSSAVPKGFFCSLLNPTSHQQNDQDQKDQT